MRNECETSVNVMKCDMMQYIHPGRAINGTQKKHNNNGLDKVTYHLKEGQNISMYIEKEPQIMFGHLQPKKMNENPLEKNLNNVKQLDRPPDSRNGKIVSIGKQDR